MAGMLVIDPFNENVATDETGELLGLMRWLPVKDDYSTPTMKELTEAPIVGYGKFIGSDDVG